MKDELRAHQEFAAYLDAQTTFDEAVDTFIAASDAADRALAVKTKASAAMTAQLAEVDRLRDQLAQTGERTPDIIAHADMAKAIRQGRELGEIHAALEACAPPANAAA